MFELYYGLLLLALSSYTSAFHEYYVKFSNNGPIIFGANITFTANLFMSDGRQPQGSYRYKWKDNLNPQNLAETVGNATSTWTVHYPSDKYNKPGSYMVMVYVYEEHFIIDWPLCRGLGEFKLTNFLNGNLTLLQGKVTRDKGYISNLTEVLHKVELNAPDLEYIKQNASTINTYWYINCNLVGGSSDLTFRHNYTDVGAAYDVDVLVMASNLTTSNATTSEIKYEDTTLSNVTANSISDVSYNPTVISVESFHNVPVSHLTSDIPFDCATRNITDNKSRTVMALFSRKFMVKAPIQNITVTGNQWLKHGDMLNIKITCEGSGPFKYCKWFDLGYYNTTGNETCNFLDVSETCEIEVYRYFRNSTHYSIVLVIENDLSKVVRSIGVDVYDVTKHPQLSVIVVPVAAAIMAVVLIIFGIAYYFQNRHTFTIEVADFDFSTNANGMEYKTFRERLAEAFHNAFDKTEELYEEDSTNGVPVANSSRKYGSMQ